MELDCSNPFQESFKNVHADNNDDRCFHGKSNVCQADLSLSFNIGNVLYEECHVIVYQSVEDASLAIRRPVFMEFYIHRWLTDVRS